MKEHTHTSEIICPYCDYSHPDSWEESIDMEDGDHGEIDCDRCEKPFEFNTYRTTTYTSYPKGMK